MIDAKANKTVIKRGGKMTRIEIENLKIGNLVPNCFGKMMPIVSIYGRGISDKGKAFICFYQTFGSSSTMSNSIRES